MANVVTYQPGGYRFIALAFQYSGGVVAEPGFAIERARWRECWCCRSDLTRSKPI
jgi:hypothetical protein